jgi:hypothetical protein
MYQLPTWNGYIGMSEQPGSPKWDLSNNRTTIVRVWEGPFALCLSNQPTKGQPAADLGDLYLAEHITVEPMPGGKGRLTVTYETQGPGTNDPVYEIEYVATDKPLESHPRYRPDGAMPLTTNDLVALQFWDNEPIYANKIVFKFEDADNNPQTLSTQAQDLAAKKLRGQTSYALYSPVCRATVSSRTLPVTFGAGFIDTPTVPSAPSGYTYLKTADRATMTGRHTKWEQQEEWTGADYIDPDIYPSSGS